VAGADEVLVLHPAVYDNVHAKFNKLIYIGLDGTGVRAGQTAGLQIVFELFQGSRIYFIGVLPQKLKG
jgi:hypothetical protein